MTGIPLMQGGRNFGAIYDFVYMWKYQDFFVLFNKS